MWITGIYKFWTLVLVAKSVADSSQIYSIQLEF